MHSYNPSSAQKPNLWNMNSLQPYRNSRDFGKKSKNNIFNKKTRSRTPFIVRSRVKNTKERIPNLMQSRNNNSILKSREKPKLLCIFYDFNFLASKPFWKQSNSGLVESKMRRSKSSNLVRGGNKKFWEKSSINYEGGDGSKLDFGDSGNFRKEKKIFSVVQESEIKGDKFVRTRSNSRENMKKVNFFY